MASWSGGKDGSEEGGGALLLATLSGAALVLAWLIILFVSVVLAPAALLAAGGGGDGGACPPAAAIPGRSALPADSPAMSAPGATDCIDPDGNAVVAVALAMAAHLHGDPDVWYDAGFPQAVIDYWERTCPGCGEWRNGNVQCVMLALAAYGVAGIHPPAAGNAITFWSLYQDRPGWVEIPAAVAPLGQRGQPRPGDWMVWYSAFEPSVGHIAVVVRVEPPSGDRPGSVTFAEANGPGPIVTEPLLPDLTVQTWSGYAVVGYIRHV